MAYTLPTIGFSASETCDSQGIKIIETTGSYESPGNTGGWGLPNATVGMVLDAELIVTTPNGTDYTITYNDMNGMLPNNNLGAFIIHMGLLGGTVNTTMTQGLYTIKYRVLIQYNLNPVQATWLETSQYVFLSNTIKCCVHKMLAALDMCDDGCPCNSEKQKALEAYTLYKALLYANQCGNVDSAVKIHDQVVKLCTYTDGPCNTCS